MKNLDSILKAEISLPTKVHIVIVKILTGEGTSEDQAHWITGQREGYRARVTEH